MLKEREKFLREATIILDAIVVIIAFGISFFFRKSFHYFYKFDLLPSVEVVAKKVTGSLSEYTLVILTGALVWCIMLYLSGMYKSMRTKSVLEITSIVIRSAFFAAVAFSAVVFFMKFKFVSRFLFVFFMLISSALLILEKTILYSIIHHLRKKGYNYRRFLIVGTGRRTIKFIRRIKAHKEWGLYILGIVDDAGSYTKKELEGIEVVGNLGEIANIIGRLSADEVVFMVPRSRLNYIEKAVYECETLGVKATVALDLFDLKIARARQTELDNIPFITFETAPSHQWQLFMKRLIDLFISGLGIILLSIPLLAVALLIRLTSKGPALFLQKRIGLNGRKFVLFKFRTMQADAQRRRAKLESLNMMNGPVFKMKDDPRITGLGKFLRKFSIDELPQLLNVFRGEMSLVGPRPAVYKEVLQYEHWQRRRLSMRPGITCLWQVSGRNKIADFSEWMKLDLQYVDSWSLWLDFKILMQTIPVVIFGIGAH